MKKNSKKVSQLRKRAEDALQGKAEELQDLSTRDARSMIHELQVHQIELEMQNEELRRAQKELEESRDRYSDLYDFAPVGYFSFDKNGLIIEVNLTGAKKLGVERNFLIKKPFSLFISPGSKDVFYLHLRQVFNTETQMTCELRLVDKKGHQFDALLESMPVHDNDGNLRARTAMSDITERKHAEEEIRLHEIRLKDLLELHRMSDAAEKEVLYFTLEACLRSVQSEFAFIGMMNADETVMTIHAWSSGAMEQCTKMDKPIEYPIAQAGLWGEVVRQRRPIIVNDYDTSCEFKKGYPRGHVPIERFLGIPIFSGDRIVAVAAVANKLSEYTESDISAFTSLLHEMWNLIERKRTEEALHEGEKLLREAQIIAGMGNYVMDIPTGLWKSSEVLDKVFGIDETYERSVEGWEALFHPDDRTMMVDYFRNEVLGKSHTFNKEYRIIRHDDHAERWLHGLGKLEFDAQGHPLKMHGTIQDITERKKAEEAIRNTLAYTESIVDTIREPLVILDAHQRLKAANHAFYKTFKIPIEDTKDKLLYELGKCQWNIPKLRELLEKIIPMNTQFQDFEIEQEFPIIGRKAMLLNACRLKLAGTDMILLAIEDITERKKLEGLRLENERLISASKARSEFLTIMSHELRTPLTSVIGYSIILQGKTHGELNEKQRVFVDNILESSKHLLDLINNFLELAKTEAGRQEMVFEEISIPDAINEIFELIKENAIGNDIILRKEFDPDMLSIQADRRALKQILFNLLSNAIKFSKKEGGIITVSTKRENDMVKISVADTGIGIKEEDLPRLFQKFEQLDSGISRKYEGTGLGLAITKQLVELHGGRIWVESKYGEGSTFTFMLPLSAKDTK